MPKARALTLLALIVALAPAAAASAEAPPLEDAEGDTSTAYHGLYGDIVAAWVEGETEQELTVVMKLKQVDAHAMRGAYYGVSFAHRNLGYYVGAFVDGNGAANGEHGHFDPDTPAPLDSQPSAATVEPGTPGHVRVVFPKAFLEREPPEGWTRSEAPELPYLDRFDAVVFDFKVYAAPGSEETLPWNDAVMRADAATGAGRHMLLPPPPAEDEGAGEEVPEPAPAVENVEASPGAAPAATERETPLPPAVALLALAAAAMTAARRRGQA